MSFKVVYFEIDSLFINNKKYKKYILLLLQRFFKKMHYINNNMISFRFFKPNEKY